MRSVVELNWYELRWYVQSWTTQTEWIHLSDATNMFTYFYCNSFIPHPPPGRGGYHQHHLHPSSIHPLVISSPPSSGVNPCTLISYLYSTLPPPTIITLHLHYLASVLSFYLYLTIPDLSLISSFLLWKVWFIDSYLRSLPYTNTPSYHPQCYYIAVSLYPPP